MKKSTTKKELEGFVFPIILSIFFYLTTEISWGICTCYPKLFVPVIKNKKR
jgi:hypothetical protein